MAWWPLDPSKKVKILTAVMNNLPVSVLNADILSEYWA
jgi:hypothetical protein